MECESAVRALTVVVLDIDPQDVFKVALATSARRPRTGSLKTAGRQGTRTREASNDPPRPSERPHEAVLAPFSGFCYSRARENLQDVATTLELRPYTQADHTVPNPPRGRRRPPDPAESALERRIGVL